MCVNPVNFAGQSTGTLLILRWGNLGTEMLSHLLKPTQSVGCGVRIQTHSSAFKDKKTYLIYAK